MSLRILIDHVSLCVLIDHVSLCVLIDHVWQACSACDEPGLQQQDVSLSAVQATEVAAYRQRSAGGASPCLWTAARGGQEYLSTCELPENQVLYASQGIIHGWPLIICLTHHKSLPGTPFDRSDFMPNVQSEYVLNVGMTVTPYFSHAEKDSPSDSLVVTSEIMTKLIKWFVFCRYYFNASPRLVDHTQIHICTRSYSKVKYM